MPKAVEGRVQQGVVVLTVKYGLGKMMEKDASETLSKGMIDEYNEKTMQRGGQVTKAPPCVVIIQAETAGSPLIRALMELYKTVRSDGGEVRLVGYPDVFIEALYTVGLTDLPGFKLFGTEQEAISG